MKRFVCLIVVPITLALCLGCHSMAAQASGKNNQVYRGQLQVLIADDFKGQSTQTHYLLVSTPDGTALRLDFAIAPPDPPLPSGTHVEILGRRQDHRLIVESLRVLK